MLSTVSIFHVLFTGPLFVYLGKVKPQIPLVYHIILALGIALGIYFLYKILIEKHKSPWIVLHLLLFVPLLVWIGLMGTAAPPFLFSILVAIGCAAIGYHGIKLFT
ncbi:hypothetical protein PBCV1_A130R [Paramecium bursaria Chlorella virus 1]|uniref:Uncharacterized protein n=1 Tax=Paramecium bursaria Chlorella virus 1 TaxID=10506 RepID=Q84450_PBCV1|nr:hypothetical protein PBCV1_A130R [Paramecium bursaria Chlorella virus 1]AAC96498.1 hypothetical protein [Paramecium bursaria Chlorella virus 1]